MASTRPTILLERVVAVRDRTLPVTSTVSAISASGHGAHGEALDHRRLGRLGRVGRLLPAGRQGQGCEQQAEGE